MSIFSSYIGSGVSRQRYIVPCLLAAMLFILVLVLVTLLPFVSRQDAFISEWLQAYRRPIVDRAMLVITLSADGFVTTVIVTAVLLFLLFRQRWWLAVHLGCVYLSAKLGVAIIKVLVSRARPETVDGSLAFYSFPSGHATSAAVVAGLLAVLLAYRQSTTVSHVIYGVAALLAVLIGVSRVYLLAHWPTDIIAGLAIGYALVVSFAWQLHNAEALEDRGLPWVILGASVMAIAFHVLRTFDEQVVRYAIIS